MEENNNAGGVALILGILSIVGALVSMVIAFGGGFFGMCCPMFGFLAGIVPLVAGILALIGTVWSVIVWRRPATSEDDSNGTMAAVGLGLNALALLLDLIAGVIAVGPSLLMMFLSVVNAILN